MSTTPNGGPTPTIIHFEGASTFGGSIRSLENYLVCSSDRYRHVVGVYNPISQDHALAQSCDRLVAWPNAGNFLSQNRLATLRRFQSKLLWQMQLLRQERAALVRFNNGPFIHLPGLLAARLLGVPQVCWLRSFPPPHRQSGRVQNWLTAQCSYVAVSEAVRQAHIARGIAPERVETIHNATVIPALRDEDDVQEAQGARHFGTLGRLVGWKGLLDVVRAAAIVKETRPDLSFSLCGNEDPTEPNHRDEILAAMKQLGVEDTVTLPGFTHDPQSVTLGFDVLLNPSSPAEPFGMSIVEAMALRRPVIATNAGGPAEIIENGISGRLVPERDPQALAQAILELANDPKLWATLARNARTRVEGHFDIRQETAATEATFARLIHP